MRIRQVKEPLGSEPTPPNVVKRVVREVVEGGRGQGRIQKHRIYGIRLDYRLKTIHCHSGSVEELKEYK